MPMQTLYPPPDIEVPHWLPAPEDHPPPRDFLARLIAGGAITKFQANWIKTIWPNLDEDAFAHPYLQTVREHTRAYLEREAGQGGWCRP